MASFNPFDDAGGDFDDAWFDSDFSAAPQNSVNSERGNGSTNPFDAVLKPSVAPMIMRSEKKPLVQNFQQQQWQQQQQLQQMQQPRIGGGANAGIAYYGGNLSNSVRAAAQNSARRRSSMLALEKAIQWNDSGDGVHAGMALALETSSFFRRSNTP